MEDVFVKILNMSITASYFVVALIILRAVFRKIPKWLSCALWGLVGLRLILPFSFESILSLVPSVQTIPSDIAMSKNPQISSGIPAFNSVINPIISESFTPEPSYSVNPLQVVSFVLAVIWLAGIAGMLIYTLVSYIILRRKTNESIKNNDGTYICDVITSPFILGIIKPKIYIPSQVTEEDKRLIIAHERAHIKRLDHLWKPLGFLLLSVYWFNPLMWIAYIFLCRDIEAACDERVLKNGGTDIKKSYSEALINCSAPKRLVTACPLAFGETGVKQRIKNVLSYKKPALWIIIIALIVSIILSVCFMTDPAGTGINDIPGYESVFRDVTRLQFFTGESRIYTTEDPAEELRALKKIKLGKAGDVLFNYDYMIEINDRFVLGIDETFTFLRIYDNCYINNINGVINSPDLSPVPTSAVYSIENPELIKKYFLPEDNSTIILNAADGIAPFSDLPGVYLSLNSAEINEEGVVSFNVNWHNETDKPLTFGEMFRIEYISEDELIDITPRGAVWHTIACLLKPDAVIPHTFAVLGLDLSLNGSYRFVTTVSIDGENEYSYECGFIFNVTGTNGGLTGPAPTTGTRALTLDDVIELSKKGKDLSWADFEKFAYVETGSGLYIRLYKIDSRFGLSIGGSGTDSEPMYIYLSTGADYIDIRGDDVNTFIERYKDSPVPVPGLSFGRREFPVDSTGENLNEMVNFGAYLPKRNFDHIMMLPTVRIDSYEELERFYSYFESKIDAEMTFEDTGMPFSEIKEVYGQNVRPEFFDEQCLLINYVTASDSADRFEVISLQRFDETLHINIRESAYEPTENSVITGWFLVTEAYKSQLAGITSIEACVGETLMLPEPEITHIYFQAADSGNIYARSLTLYDDGTFMLSVSPYSSFLEIGSFEYQGELLILTSEDGERHYVFEVNSDSITFRRDESVVYKLFTEDEVPDKTRFILQ